jgi:CheY-like chemotaxis protein
VIPGTTRASEYVKLFPWRHLVGNAIKFTDTSAITMTASATSGRNTIAVGLKGIPVIVVTSYALSGDEGKARAAGCDAAGCDAYVTKPYSPRQLPAKIKEFLPSQMWRIA